MLNACGSSEPGVNVQTAHDCDDTYCNVQIVIQNPGRDSHFVEYEVSAYKSSRGGGLTLVGELEGSHTVSGKQSISLSKQFRVLAKPNAVGTSTSVTRGT